VSQRETILVWVSGRDHPGITAGILDIIAAAGAVVQDVEQISIRNRLTLGFAIDVPAGRDLLKDLLLFGWDHDLQVDFEVAEDSPSPAELGHVVTVLGPVLSADLLRQAAVAVADAGGNIHRILRLSRYPVFSYELVVRGADDHKLRANLLSTATRNAGLDVAVQNEGLGRRAKRLVVLDVDSTLIQDEVIDLLGEEAGVGVACHALTVRAMRGELDFEQALRQRVALLEGADEAIVDRARAKLRLTPGARTFVRTLKRLGYRTAIVSGGFTAFTDDLREKLGLDHAYANELEIVDGVLTGRVVGPVVDRARKEQLLRAVAELEDIPLEQTVAVGDGANDLDMLSIAGLGIAFNAKPVVEDAADTAVTVPYLDAILFVLGVRRLDIEAVDAEENGGEPMEYPSVDPSG